MPQMLAIDASEVPTEKVAAEKKMFTPTTKKVLDEIANTTSEATIPPSSSSGVKRNLAFADVTPKIEKEAAKVVPKVLAESPKKQPRGENPSSETPSKKNRGYGPTRYALFISVYAGLEVLAIPTIPLTMSAGLLFGSLIGTMIVTISGHGKCYLPNC